MFNKCIYDCWELILLRGRSLYYHYGTIPDTIIPIYNLFNNVWTLCARKSLLLHYDQQPKKELKSL